jgi:hypothetical protein
MADTGKKKLSDALSPEEAAKLGRTGDGKRTQAPDVSHDQAAEAEASKQAARSDNNADINDRLVEIGRGHLRAGRQGQ